MTAHTPGPWSVSNGHLLRVTTTTRLPLVICGIHRLGKNGGPAIGDPHANARLIAAAPELLKALKGLLVLFEEIDGGANDHADEFIAARRAISKAEGKL